MYSNSKVEVRDFAKKGRGLVAAKDIQVGELIIRSPVRVLEGMEYRILRSSWWCRGADCDFDNLRAEALTLPL